MCLQYVVTVGERDLLGLVAPVFGPTPFLGRRCVVLVGSRRGVPLLGPPGRGRNGGADID